MRSVKSIAGVESKFKIFCSDFAQSKVAVCAAVVFMAIVVMAFLSPWITWQNPYNLAQIDILDGRLPPGSKSINGQTFWLGTDDQGRDIISAILYGIRISLIVGLISCSAALLLGIAIGLSGAYFGGRLDTFIMRVVDLQLGFPSLLIALVLVAVLGRGTDKVIIALILTQWAFYARTVRSTALIEREKEYIEAAVGLGLPQTRIIFRHLLPNCIPPIIVVSAVNIAHAIQLEATLSFLGVGLPITEPSLGLLISNGFKYILSGEYWISVFPGVVLFVAVASINLMADQLREVLNPRLKK